MICHFTATVCRYVDCPLYKEDEDACKFALLLDRFIETKDKEEPLSCLTTKEVHEFAGVGKLANGEPV